MGTDRVTVPERTTDGLRIIKGLVAAVMLLGTCGVIGYATLTMLLAPLAVNTGSSEFREGFQWMASTWLFIISLWVLFVANWRYAHRRRLRLVAAALSWLGFALAIVSHIVGMEFASRQVYVIWYALPVLLLLYLTLRLLRSNSSGIGRTD